MPSLPTKRERELLQENHDLQTLNNNQAREIIRLQNRKQSLLIMKKHQAKEINRAITKEDVFTKDNDRLQDEVEKYAEIMGRFDLAVTEKNYTIDKLRANIIDRDFQIGWMAQENDRLNGIIEAATPLVHKKYFFTHEKETLRKLFPKQ
jgi:hypothetical protein